MATRFPNLRAALLWATVLGCGWTWAAEGTPAFEAPEKAPRDPMADRLKVEANAGPLNLDEAMALALMGSPELAMVSWEVRAGEARALQAGASPNPELDLRLLRMEMPDDNPADETARKRVILSHDLELGGKRKRRVVLAEAENDLTRWDYKATRDEVASSVAAQFAAVLAEQRRVESQRGFVEFVETTRDRVRQLVEIGSMRELETHRVDGAAGMARIGLQRAESALSAGRHRLAATWGSDSPRFTEVVGDLDRVSSIPDIATVIELSKQSPGVARWETELARGQAALALAKARRVPDLTYGVGVRWEEALNQRDYIVDLEISLPIFDTKRGEIREAQHEMARAVAGKQAAQASRSAAVAETYYILEESLARITTMRDVVVPAAREAFEAYRKGFDSDVNLLRDLVDARRDLAKAENQYIDALVDYRLTLPMLESLVGQSLTTDR